MFYSLDDCRDLDPVDATLEDDADFFVVDAAEGGGANDEGGRKALPATPLPPPAQLSTEL